MTKRNRDSQEPPSASGMSLRRFAALAEAYGGDFERWPEAERFAAVSLAGRSKEARSLLADAHGLDYLLSRHGTPPAPSDELVERVAALERESGLPVETAPPGDRAAISVAATARRGSFSSMRSNALALSIVLNLILAGVLGGVWMESRPAPGTASGTAYIQADAQATVSDEGEAGPGEELGALIPMDPSSAGFDADSFDDFETAGWPDGDQPSIDGVSTI